MKIVLMRSSSEENDSYHTTLKVIGDVTSIPVLAFSFVNTEILCDKLFPPISFSGIVLTSKRAVDAIRSACLHRNAGLPSEWENLPCYTVGDATASEAGELGFACVGEESGSAENLAHFIVHEKRSRPDSNLLFVCSQQRRDTLPQILRENNISFESVVAYESRQDSLLEKNILSYVENDGAPNFIVYFSPLGFKYSYDAWVHALGNKCGTVKVEHVAIGETTASAVRKRHPCVITARKPTPEALLEAIQQHVRSVPS